MTFFSCHEREGAGTKSPVLSVLGFAFSTWYYPSLPAFLRTEKVGRGGTPSFWGQISEDEMHFSIFCTNSYFNGWKFQIRSQASWNSKMSYLTL